MAPLSMKRKNTRDDDNDDVVDYRSTKHMKVATQNYMVVNEVAMSDAAQNYVPFPTLGHSSSSSSLCISTGLSPTYTIDSLPSEAATPSSAYPSFDLYPEADNLDSMDIDMSTSTSTHAPTRHHHSLSTISTDSHLGLMQPTTSTAMAHGQNCTQIPRLRMASYAGLDGKRSMWSHCPQCGAIEMVKS